MLQNSSSSNCLYWTTGIAQYCIQHTMTPEVGKTWDHEWKHGDHEPNFTATIGNMDEGGNTELQYASKNMEVTILEILVTVMLRDFAVTQSCMRVTWHKLKVTLL